MQFAAGRGPLKYPQRHRQYGSVIRTEPNYMVIFKAELIPIIYDARQDFCKVQVV